MPWLGSFGWLSSARDAGEIPWYLSGGIAAANCIAAYKAIGAASLAASYVNLANPGTYDMTAPTSPPSFDALTGWTFLAGSSQVLFVACPAIATHPCSIVVRFSSDNVTSNYVAASVIDTALNANNYFCIYVAGGVASDPTSATTAEANSEASALTTAGYTASTFYTAAATFAAANARVAYLNGANKATETTSKTASGLDTLVVGARYTANAYGSFFSGKVSSCAFYNIALSDAQVLALHTAMAALT